MRNVTSVQENLNLPNMSICLGQDHGSPGYFFWNDHATVQAPEKFAATVIGDYYWSVPMEQAHLAGGSFHDANVSKKLKKLSRGTISLGCTDSNSSAIVDTGTSLLAAPSEIADAIYEL